MMARLGSLISLAVVLSGCATSPPAEGLVKTATVQVTASDFCEIMRAVLPPTGKFLWSVGDTPESITHARRLNAAYDTRCVPIKPRQTS